MTSRIGVLGAGGRMGRAIIEEIGRVETATLAGAAERPGHPDTGSSLGIDGLCITANSSALAHASDALVDFTTPDALKGNLDAALDAECALVIGTTGLKSAHHDAIDAAAKHIPILQTANTSLGVTLLAKLVEQAASALGEDWDIEVVEMHHRMKADAPSGTALMLGEAA
ncbi:MAG: 4-hydroxy-tetrahydrodipicolinate reductase, partial [Pacificimonas sp.]